MKLAIEILAASLMATALMVAVQLVMRPAPIPALTGLMGGLVVFWVARRRRYTAAGVGLLVGTLIGVGVHGYSHYSEGRLDEPSEGMMLHLFQDGLVGVVIAAVILFLTFRTLSRLPGKTG